MICNAAVFNIPVTMREMPMDDFMLAFNLNFFCPVVMTKEALPHLEKTKGNIVYVSSIISKEGHQIRDQPKGFRPKPIELLLKRAISSESQNVTKAEMYRKR